MAFAALVGTSSAIDVGTAFADIDDALTVIEENREERDRVKRRQFLYIAAIILVIALVAAN